MARNGILSRFQSVLKTNGWLDERPVLLGVSGGSDSMSLLRLYSETLDASKIVVAHMDHGLRETAERDRSFVAERCAALGVQCVIERCPVGELMRRGESEESAGRRLRYELYEHVRSEFGCGFAALGHTRSDLAENALMNIARGCGLWGLGGMPRQRGFYIRPLLGFSRSELREYLLGAGWSWVEDESNDSDAYQRNRVRHEVIPLLAQRVNSGIAAHLADLAEEALAWREEEDDEGRRLLESVRAYRGSWLGLELSKLRRLRPFELARLIRFCGRILRLKCLSRERTAELCRLVMTSGRWVFQWGSEVDVRAQDGCVRWAPAREKKLHDAQLRLGETIRWGGWKISLRENTRSDDDDFGFSCAIDASQPVTVCSIEENSIARDSDFPVVLQKNVFCAQKRSKGWEIERHSVKYNVVCHIVLKPLMGCWREDVWNLEQQRF
ncbi:MAG: tRNA lysidine(34) synthetase TilS [Pyramidobacter sp.]|nr:tRNA lysidine(34) synthetase TilS [Pyramidobacter sp.]